MSDFFIPEKPALSWLPPFMQFSGKMTARAIEWKTLLYDLLFSVYDVKLPEGWLPSPFRYMLFGWGSVGVGYSDKYGWVYGSFAVEKKDWQYTPLKFRIILPYETDEAQVEVIRGVNGAILHLRDNWTGYDLLINQYAKILAELDKGVDANAKQVKFGKIVGVNDKKDADTLREALNRSGDGDPVVYLNKRFFDPDTGLNVSNMIADLAGEFLGDRIMETRLMILKDFLTRVGVRTVGMEKREHLLDQEIAENNDETSAEPNVILTSLKPELELLNAMGCKLSIDLKYDYSGAGQGEAKEVDKNVKQDA
jgi:hypothetical protein